jgi:hypothetical protein
LFHFQAYHFSPGSACAQLFQPPAVAYPHWDLYMNSSTNIKFSLFKYFKYLLTLYLIN